MSMELERPFSVPLHGPPHLTCTPSPRSTRCITHTHIQKHMGDVPCYTNQHHHSKHSPSLLFIAFPIRPSF
jgi:hypothetical protein